MRTAKILFKTRESSIGGEVSLDAFFPPEIVSPFHFFSHTMETLAFYSGIGLRLRAESPLFDNRHHLVEDCGIALGRAIRNAADEGKAVARYGFFLLPMDETLVSVALDLSNRGCFVLAGLDEGRCQGEELSWLSDFGWGFCRSLGATLHCKLEYGSSPHHIAEALFKALGFSLGQALRESPRGGTFSTKGEL